jgi:hypothetical protein
VCTATCSGGSFVVRDLLAVVELPILCDRSVQPLLSSSLLSRIINTKWYTGIIKNISLDTTILFRC